MPNVLLQFLRHARGEERRAPIGRLFPLEALFHNPIVNCQESPNAGKPPYTLKDVVHALNKVVREVIEAQSWQLIKTPQNEQQRRIPAK